MELDTMKRTIIPIALMLALAMAAVPISDSDAVDPEIKGISLDYYGIETYTMMATYYTGDYISMQFTDGGDAYDPQDPTETYTSEIGHAVYMVLKSTSDQKLKETVHPFKMLKSVGYKGLYGGEIPDGLYKLEILDSTKTLVVGCYLYIGETVEAAILPPEEADGEVTVTDRGVPTELTEDSEPVKTLVPLNAKIALPEDGSKTPITFYYEHDSVKHEFLKAEAGEVEGKNFAGWFTGEGKDQEIEVGQHDVFADDMEILAKWAFTYRLHFDQNATGTVSGMPEDIVEDDVATTHDFTIPSQEPDRSGYKFKGWSETAAGQAQYTKGQIFTATELESTLYAVWESEEPPVPPGPTPEYLYRLIYDANGGTGAPNDQVARSQFASYSMTISAVVPQNPDAYFTGWSTNAAGSPEYQPGDSIIMNSSNLTVTLYAVWSGSEISHIEAQVDSLTLAPGDSVRLSVTTTPPGYESSLSWSVSPSGVVTVDEHGRITAVADGTAYVTVSSADGKVSIRIPVTVTNDPEVNGTKTIETDNGGRVIIYFTADESGILIPTNPVEIYPGTQNDISYQQVGVADWYISEIKVSGVDPYAIVYTKEQEINIPYELLDSVARDRGTLTADFYGEVTLTFGSEVLYEIGLGEDLELVVIPVPIETEETDIDVSSLGDDVKVYDIYMLRNGARITKTLVHGIGVGIDYPLEDGQVVEKVHVHYVDVDPFEEYTFIYADGKVNFTVHHFSHYAVSYESESKSGDNIVLIAAGIGIILLIVLLLLILLVFGRKKIRLDLDGGVYVFVPEGWKSESSSVIYRRFKKGDELIIPKVDARMGGATVIGWHPDPPKEVEKSETFKAVWSSQNDL